MSDAVRALDDRVERGTATMTHMLTASQDGVTRLLSDISAMLLGEDSDSLSAQVRRCHLPLSRGGMA